MFTRKCPQCNSVITHTMIDNRNRAERKNKICSNCTIDNKKFKALTNKREYNGKRYSLEQVKTLLENWNDKILVNNLIVKYEELKSNPPAKIYKKDCPECEKEIIFNCYSTYSNSIRNNCTCKPCSIKKIAELGRSQTGENNPFYGKKHTDETRVKMHLAWENPSEARQKQIDNFETEEWKNKTIENFSEYNKDRNKFGTLKEIWVRKLGEEEGLKRWDEWKKRLSVRSSGENNPMHGKPSPTGSGNGWSGWYKGWYFRSLLELSYMISIIERFNIPWENGEIKGKFKVPYVDYEGKTRNYFPDFVLDGKYMVEIKPTKLWDTPSIMAKKSGAEIFCKENGLKYKLTNCRKLKLSEICELYLSNDIKFLDRYEEKFKLLLARHKLL